jgi:precorrin-6B methylase 2
MILIQGTGPSGHPLAVELAADSAALLDRVRVQAWPSAIDLGCGPRGTIDMLAARTGPAGRVVGLDADPVTAGLASAFAAEHGLSNVQVVTAGAATACRRLGVRAPRA